MTAPAWARRVLAPNPGPMTLEGTNTWVLRAGDTAGSLVVDPGPLDEDHLAAVARTGPVALVVLTHSHPDHADGAPRLAALTGAPVRALDPAFTRGADALRPDEVLGVAGMQVRVLATPGHTADSVCLLAAPARPGLAASPEAGADPAAGPGSLPDAAVLTGDTILGRGSSVVAHPDGRLASYLASLRLLTQLGPLPGLPGHGPVLDDVASAARGYLDHRASRLEQVRAAAAAGAVTPADVVRQVYGDLEPGLAEAAQLSARAQLDYLREQVSGPGAPGGPGPG